MIGGARVLCKYMHIAGADAGCKASTPGGGEYQMPYVAEMGWREHAGSANAFCVHYHPPVVDAVRYFLA